jgi:methylmalonyl-CoA mutase N-terminal domain/subunit
MSADRLFDRYLEGERPADCRTRSGIELPGFLAAPPAGPPGEPGAYPFTRGIHAEMYRRRLWTRRQQSGYGTPRASNERLHYLLRQGATGLNIDTDMATKLGADPDHPLFEGEIGRQGTSVATLEDMAVLLDGIPLDRVSSTLIVQPPASAPFLAMYLEVARARGIPPAALIGTIMNCALTQLSGATLQANTHFFPIDFSVRVGLDVMEHCARAMPRWNIVNVNAYNIRETGVDAVQEAAFALSVAAHYVEALLARGLPVDAFAPRMAFFTAAHLDLFEEVAKLRAMRRIWARLVRERWGARDDRSCWFRTAIQTAALPLTAQEPLNNIVRATIQTLAAVLGGSQSIHTTSYDEAYALPSEASHRLSLRTQQVIAFETDVVKSADPLGGAYLVEWLTDRLETAILALMEEIRRRGGFLRAFQEGWIEGEIRRARQEALDRVESGAQPVVGVNCFQDKDEGAPEVDVFDPDPGMAEARVAYIREYRARRVAPALPEALAAVGRAAAGTDNVMPPVLAAVAAGATIGEVCHTFAGAIGHRPGA